MRIVASGATGFIGTNLCSELLTAGHQVAVLTRRPADAQRMLPGGVEAIGWDPTRREGEWVDRIGGFDAVVNLAGTSIASGRWNARRKQAIVQSRLDSTSALVHAVQQAPAASRPKTFVSFSAIGYYGDRGEETLTEESGPGADFLARLCQDWEGAARAVEPAGVRLVIPRIGVVLGHGGALQPLVVAYKVFAGGPLGSGRQWWSWIHMADVTGLVRYALEHEPVMGVVNATAPNPRRMREIGETLGRVMGRPSWAPAPAFALRLLLGEMADALVLASQRVLPRHTLACGYQFRFPDLEPALRDLQG